MHLQGQQYVCAGELIALQTMTNVLNYLKVKKIDFAKVNSSSCSNFLFHCNYSWLRLSVLKKWRKCSATSSNCVLRGLRSNRKLKVISSSSKDLLPSLRASSWDWCALPLSVPLGWGFTFPCLYADFSHHEFSFELIFFFQIFPRKSILAILTQICL